MIEQTKITEQCQGCARIEGEYCQTYPRPSACWRTCKCPMATHIKREDKSAEKVRVGQQKQKKRAK